MNSLTQNPGRAKSIFGSNDLLSLLPIADELSAIAARLRQAGLAEIATCESEDQSISKAPVRQGANPIKTVRDIEKRRVEYGRLAAESYRMRRARAELFGDANLFGEPAWDILLDLYLAFAQSKKVSVSSACIGSSAPSTTGLRWLGILTEAGLLERENDKGDQRRVLVKLSPKAIEAMEKYFDGVLGIFQH